MANLRVKKKHLNPDAVDGTKLKLLKGESIRIIDESDAEVELVKLDALGNVIGNGFELAKKVDLEAEVSSRQAALSAEESARIAADDGLDSRLDDVETNLETSIETLFENNAAAYADAAAGVQDPNFREGWYFKNAVAEQKINWYFFDGQAEEISLGDFSTYAVVTADSTGSLPFLAFYTTPTGSGDAAAWYKSRLVYTPSGSVVAGKKYLMYVGQDPQVHPELPRLTMTKSSSSAGTQDAGERILTASLGSNSAAAVNSCEFVAESVGIFSPSIRRKVQLKIRKASQVDVDAEISRAMAAEAALQDAIVAESSSRQAAIADLINSAPAVLDTLKELADALGGDENFATTIANRFSSIESSLTAATEDGTGYTDLKHQEILDLISDTLLKKEEVTITAQNVADGYVTLAGTNVISKSMTAFIDRLAVFEGEDFSLSVVDGATRMTFLNSFAPNGDEGVEENEKIRLTYWSLV